MYERSKAFLAGELNRRAAFLTATADATARQLRGPADGLRAEGVTRGLALPADRLADTVERAGRYIEGRDVVVLADELRAAGRRRPWTFALAGFAGGFAAIRVARVVSLRNAREAAREADDGRE